MNEVDISFSGKYNALLNGFIYKDGKKHPEYNWLERVNVEEIAAGIDIFNPEYDRLLKEALISAYNDVILNDPLRPDTVQWYLWEDLANSVK
jgi:hypothetical protein